MTQPLNSNSSEPELPRFLGQARPAPESAARRLLIRGFAIVAIAISYSYLIWRTTSTVDLSVWWLALPLLIVELHNALGLTLYTLGLWDIDHAPEWRAVEHTDARIAVLLPTYGKSVV